MGTACCRYCCSKVASCESSIDGVLVFPRVGAGAC